MAAPRPEGHRVNIVDFQQGLFIAFNPILLLLLAIYVAAVTLSAFGDVFNDVTRYLKDRLGRR